MREFRFLRDTWRIRIGCGEDNGGRVVGDGERLTGGEGGESSSGDAEGTAVVGVSGGKVVASEDGVFDKTTSFLAATDSVFVV